MNRAVFVGGLRTPFGRAFKGAYSDIRADDLLLELFKAQARANPDLWNAGPDDVIVGCAYPEGEQGYNLGRVVALGGGLKVPGATVNRLCASSLEAVAMAAARVAVDWGDIFLTAGVEAMSRVPRRGANFSESEQIKQAVPQAYINMGETAEEVARRHPEFSRRDQEELAARSHELASRAYQRHRYATQIHPYLIETDEFIRFPVDREKMASLPPAFDPAGVVTAATSSPLTDGATSGWVMRQQTAQAMGFTRGLEILDCAWAHVAPEVMGLGPVPAILKLFDRNKIGPYDVAAYEINEAFAIQVLTAIEELGLPAERVNAWGGAIAIGHPLGASGLRLVMTLHDRLMEFGHNDMLGVASLCVGGGQGMAILFRYLAEL